MPDINLTFTTDELNDIATALYYRADLIKHGSRGDVAVRLSVLAGRLVTVLDHETPKPTHTPGPWWCDDDGFIAAGSGDSYVTVADFGYSDVDIGECEANKNLAIAAPDLLAALESLMPLCEREDVAETWSEEFSAADTAIAKARSPA